MLPSDLQSEIQVCWFVHRSDTMSATTHAFRLKKNKNLERNGPVAGTTGWGYVAILSSQYQRSFSRLVFCIGVCLSSKQCLDYSSMPFTSSPYQRSVSIATLMIFICTFLKQFLDNICMPFTSSQNQRSASSLVFCLYIFGDYRLIFSRDLHRINFHASVKS